MATVSPLRPRRIPCGDCPADQSRDFAEVSAAILAMTRHLDVRQVLQTITSAARRLVGARYAALGVPDDHGGFAQFVVDGVGAEQWKAIGPLPRQHGVLADMVGKAMTHRLDDVRDHPGFGGWPDAHPELRGFLGVPITAGEEVLGALFLSNKEACTADGDDCPEDADDASGPGRFTDYDEQLLRTFADHAAIALTNARLYERSRELTITQERSRIAQELHDAVSQKLFSLRLTAQAAAALVDRDPARAREELAEVADLARQAADELRSVVVELRPAALAEDGLAAALRSEIEVLDRAHEAAVAFHGTRFRALPAAQEEAVLRIAQEALHNALRHSGADRVDVTLACRGGEQCERGAVLRVEDNGKGFDVGEVRGSGRHLGLVSMRERAAAVGGRLNVDSRPGRGTVIELEVPGGS